MSQQPVAFYLRDQTLWLSAEKCIFWEENKALILSDLHLGKTGHFRKEGIGVPQQLLEQDLLRLDGQIKLFSPSSLIIIGDLFHSRKNLEVNFFSKWRTKHHATAMHLIPGNHDILSPEIYKELNIVLHEKEWDLPPFTFTHELSNEIPDHQYQIAGHVHPGIRLNGKGKQKLRLPCYYFTNQGALLPAFGKFTGIHVIEASKDATIFAVGDNQIIKF
jgi:DNA ligase-associated metallophosphoesterase